MKKDNVKFFTSEVIKQVVKGVHDAREELNISVLRPEYIDFDIEVEGEQVHYRVSTR